MSMLPLLLTLSFPSAQAEPLPDPANCTEELATYVENVATKGEEESYLCLAARDDAKEALVGALAERTEGQHTRVSRAMAIHLLQRLDSPLEADVVFALEAVDQRLLRDGIFAHRGRKTPAPDHEKVFSKFDWYTPKAHFNKGKLTELDNQNLEVLDNRPAPVEEVVEEEPTAADAIAASQEGSKEEAAPVETWCGCHAVGAAPAAFAWILGLAALVRRRR